MAFYQHIFIKNIDRKNLFKKNFATERFFSKSHYSLLKHIKQIISIGLLVITMLKLFVFCTTYNVLVCFFFHTPF